MKHWFKDGVFRAVLRNAGYLGSTKALGAVFGLLALIAAGHALDPVTFGVLMLIHTYALGAGAITKFQSWQLILRYGGPALERDDRRTVEDSIRFAFGLDVASGLIGMVAAMLALPFLATRFGIDRAHLPIALIYCTLVPTMAAATPSGVLRLLDRFDLLAQQQIVTPALRVLGAGVAYFTGLGLIGFVITWYLADILGDLLLWAFAIRQLRRRNMLGSLRPGLFGVARRLPGSWGFAWTTNIAISLNAGWGPIGNLVVGGILGPAPAGLYKIAITLLDSAGKPADMLTKGFYPEIVRLDPSSTHPWRLAVRTGAIAGGIALLVVIAILLGGKPFIGLFGHKYIAAYGLLTLMMFSLMVEMASFPLESLLYMVGRQRAALVAQAAGTLGYLGMLAVLAHRFGLSGAGSAYLLGTAMLALFLLVPVLTSYRDRSRYAPALT